MPALTKILTFAMLSGLTIGGFYANGQSKVKQTKRHNVTIGFQSGKESAINSSPFYNSKQYKVRYGTNNRLLLRKRIKPHFSFETGLNYGLMPNQNNSNTTTYKFNNGLKQGSLSMPATLQYFFLPEKCRLRPFCGAGLQYNLYINPNTISPFPVGDVAPATSDAQTGTKYISILFTQGVTFEVNTKIQITQSFHFIPNNNNKMLGIDLGIGYTIP